MTVNADEQILRVERGHAESDELAAITAVLLVRAAGQAARAPADELRSKARWHRLERRRAFCAPHSWQD